jgi:hypothetical protein
MITHATLRRWSLVAAEQFDAWRVVPRIILIVYGWMVWKVSVWYMSIPSANQMQCQADVLRTLFEQSVPIDQARSIACSIVDTIGGPTSEQTMFVSIFTGLSSVVIGLYLNTGKTSKWQSGVIDTIQPVNTLAEQNRYQYGGYHQGGRRPWRRGSDQVMTGKRSSQWTPLVTARLYHQAMLKHSKWELVSRLPILTRRWILTL